MTEKKSEKQQYIDRITDKIIAFRMEHNSHNPKYVVMSSALFNLLTDGKGNKNKSKFGVVRVKVYSSGKLSFRLEGQEAAKQIEEYLKLSE